MFCERSKGHRERWREGEREMGRERLRGREGGRERDGDGEREKWKEREGGRESEREEGREMKPLVFISE